MTEPMSAGDYASDQEVRWCPGCGDYAILKAMQKCCADLQLSPDKTVFVSGIGCAARLPYYMNSYGFHSIHGRAPSIATGVKMASPELDVWVITGDGDALSIGGNHLFHLLRRNPDLQILLFNNEIYGLTKGQFSPASRKGTRSPSSPTGSSDMPADLAQFGLGAGAAFIARAIDTKQAELIEVLKRAHSFKGTGLVEIFQNCIVYNDKVFDDFTARDRAPFMQLWLKPGEKMLFGSEREKGLRLGEKGIEIASADAPDILVHDETNKLQAFQLVTMTPPLPVALGVIYCDPSRPTFEVKRSAKKPMISHAETVTSLNQLLKKGTHWEIEG